VKIYNRNQTCDFLPVFDLLDYLTGIVISVKILGLKFLPYIAGINGLELMISNHYRKRLLIGLDD
jgi:hypothetical protein